jgi:hypothetical protein
VGTRGLPEHRDGLRITTEVGDILANPLQGRFLILQTYIRRPELVGVEISKGTETIADRNRDDVSFVGQSGSVVPPLLSASCDIGAAMNPRHDGSLPVEIRREDREHLTRLRHLAALLRQPHDDFEARGELGAYRPRANGLSNFRQGRYRLRRPETVGDGIGDTAERV